MRSEFWKFYHKRCLDGKFRCEKLIQILCVIRRYTTNLSRYAWCNLKILKLNYLISLAQQTYRIGGQIAKHCLCAQILQENQDICTNPTEKYHHQQQQQKVPKAKQNIPIEKKAQINHKYQQSKSTQLRHIKQNASSTGEREKEKEKITQRYICNTRDILLAFI